MNEGSNGIVVNTPERKKCVVNRIRQGFEPSQCCSGGIPHSTDPDSQSKGMCPIGMEELGFSEHAGDRLIQSVVLAFSNAILLRCIDCSALMDDSFLLEIVVSLVTYELSTLVIT